MDAVLLDAYGTLVTLDAPVPRLRALLAADGHDHTEEAVGAALRAEVLHYRAHHDRGRDAASLAALRRECAGVLAAALGGDAPPPGRLADILVAALRFVPFPDALPALHGLRDLGMRIGVVSNWDCGLGDVLDDLGIAPLVDAVAVSAIVGAGKPDAAIFHDALRRLGVPARRALHCGDLPAADCAGARAAGVRAVLIDRAGGVTEGPCRRIRDLYELVEACETCNRAS
ncbi:MAG: HAD family hydrolase [Thermoleophilia bacterium]